MKLISWNIDSLNAALTGASARSELSRRVLDTIREHDPDVIALQETKLPAGGPKINTWSFWVRCYRITT